MLKLRSYISILLTFLVPLGALATSPREAVYLSFEEKMIAGYSLLAYQKSETEKAQIAKRAYNYLVKSLETHPKMVEVKNFSEFLTHFRGEWPRSGDLGVELEKIEAMPMRGVFQYRSQSPRIQRQIDQYLQKHTILMASLLMSVGNVKTFSDDFIAKQIEKFDSVGERVSISGFSAIKDPATRIGLQVLFNEYFGRQSLVSKKYMLMALMQENLNLNEERILEIMIQNSGPQFQKLLQVVTRNSGLPKELKQSFKMLESAVLEVPEWQVDEIISKEQENYKFIYFEKKPLGVGTMAQVHRAKILLDGRRQDVVVRFLKPNIEQRIRDDHRILTEVATLIDQNVEYQRTGGPKMSPLIEDISETVLAELDQEATVKRQIIAGASYDATSFYSESVYKNVIRFHVPRVFLSKNPSKIMVQEMSIGQSLDKAADAYKETIPNLKRGVVEATAKLWAKEVIFGKGFYHSDLHQGNFLVRVTDEAIHVNLLDFGMGGQLSSQMQKRFMLLGAAVALKNADLIAESYWDISDSGKNRITKEEFKLAVQKKIQELNLSNTKMGSEAWTGWASNQGIKLPYDLINLSRGRVIINNSLAEAGSSETMTSIEKQLVIHNPVKTSTALLTSARELKLKRDSPTPIKSCEAMF